VPVAEEPDSADLEQLEQEIAEATENGKIIKGDFGE
jgi:hypothetical protein